MGDEKIGIRRLEHYDLHGRVRLEVGHYCSQLDDRCWDKHVDRRIAEGEHFGEVATEAEVARKKAPCLPSPM